MSSLNYSGQESIFTLMVRYIHRKMNPSWYVPQQLQEEFSPPLTSHQKRIEMLKQQLWRQNNMATVRYNAKAGKSALEMEVEETMRNGYVSPFLTKQDSQQLEMKLDTKDWKDN